MVERSESAPLDGLTPPGATPTPFARLERAWRRVPKTLVFVVAWGFLNAVANVRYPDREPSFWYLLPSVDVVFLFAVYALLGHFRRPVRVPVHVALVGGFLLLRFVRSADGLEKRFLNRQFNFYTDLPLAPDLVRLMAATMTLTRVVLGCVALVVGFVALGWLVHRALRYSESYLARPRQALVFTSIVGVFALVSPFVPTPRHPARYLGAFAATAVPRFAAEANFMLHLYGYQEGTAQALAATKQRLARAPTDLTRLAGANVLFFLVESYGETVLDEPRYAAEMRPAYAAFEAALGARGFAIASRRLESPTFGGGSWLAHATLATGVKVRNQLEYDLVSVTKPPTMAGFFRAAGYRSVLVQPGTLRVTPGADYLGFEQNYYASAFDYRGPKLGWATFPDQYVLDVIRRREPTNGPRPLFVEYVLVTSHAPWSVVPPTIDDWSRIGNGALYRDLPAARYDSGWSDLSNTSEAYVRTVLYDLWVIQRYVENFVQDGSLVIVLGDHQPPGIAAGQSTTFGVPIHVLSREHAFVERFRARGYKPGMWAERSAAAPGFETFLIALLEDFSAGRTK